MAVSQAELKVVLSAQDQASAAIRGLSGSLSQLGAVAKGSAAPGFAAMSAAMATGTIAARAIIGAVQGIGGAIGGTANAAAGFEASLNTFQAVSGASAEQMQRAATQAKALGADMTLPATSAADAAKAMTELVRAGIDVDQALDATRGTLQLAAAAQIDEAKAAQITAAALNTFGLEGKEAGRIADELATAANASAADITDLAQGMQQAGFIFKATNRPIEELISSIGLLVSSGLSGSDAGTALKNAFIRMIDPTKEAAKTAKSLGISFFDAQGKMKPLPDIVDHLNARLAGMTDQQRASTLTTLLMSDGYKALNPLLDLGGDKLRALEGKLRTQGAAADLAGAKTKGLQGAFDGFNSQVETLQITLGQKFGPALERVTRFAAEGIGAINDAVEGLDVSAVFENAQHSLRKTSDVFFQAGQSVSTFGETLKNVPVVGQGLNRELNILGSVLTGVAAILRGDAKGAVEAFGDAFGQAQEGLNEFGRFVDTTIGNVLNTIGRLAGADVSGVEGNFEKLTTIIATVEKNVRTGVNNILGEVGKLLGLKFAPDASEADKFTAIFADIGRRIDEFRTDLGSKVESLSGEIAKLKIGDDVQQSFVSLAASAKQMADGIKLVADTGGRFSDFVKSAAGVGPIAIVLKTIGLVAEIAAGQVQTLISTWGTLASVAGNTVEGLTAMRTALLQLATGDLAGAAKSTDDAKNAFLRAKTAVDEFSASARTTSATGGAAIIGFVDELVNSSEQAAHQTSELAAMFDSDSREIAAAAQTNFGQVATTVETGMAGAVTAVESGGSQIEAASTTAFTGVATAAQTAMPGVQTATETGMEGATAAVVTAGPVMTTAMQTTGAGITTAMQTSMAETVAATETGMAGVPAAVSAQQGEAGGAAGAVGAAIVAGLRAGILGGVGQVAAAAATLVTSAINAARAAADAHSPSKKTEQLGVDMWTGLNNALAAGKLDQSIVTAIQDYVDAARSYLPIATEIARVEEEIGRVRQRAQVDGLFRELQMVDATSHLLMLKRDLAQAEADLLPNRQALAAADREVRSIEQGSLAERQQGLAIDKERAELRLRQIDLEKQLIGLPRDSKQAKAIQAELDALRDKDRALQLEADRIRVTNQIAAADAKQRREIAAEAVQQGEAAEQGTRDQIAAIEALAAVFAANEAIIKNRTDNEIKQWERVKAVFESQGAPIQERIKAGLALIDQLEAEGSISKELADKLRAVAQQATGAAKATATAVQQQAAAVEKAADATRNVAFESGGSGDVLNIDPKATVEAVEHTAAEAQAALDAANLTLPPLVVNPDTVIVPETVVTAVDLMQTELDGLTLAPPPIDPGAFTESMSGLLEAAQSSLSESESQVETTLDQFGTTVEGSIEKMTSTGASGGDKVGTAIWKGMRDGVLDGKGPLADAVEKIVKAAIEAANEAAGIHSPSRVFMKIGRLSAEGLRKGLLDGQAAAARAGGQMMAAATPTVSREAVSEATSGGRSAPIENHMHVYLDGREIEHSLSVHRDRAIRSGALR